MLNADWLRTKTLNPLPRAWQFLARHSGCGVGSTVSYLVLDCKLKDGSRSPRYFRRARAKLWT